MTNDEYIDKMTTVNEVVVYELVDTRTGARYIGQTRKDLEKTRLPQHFAEARADRAGRALHVHLQNVMDEGREDDLKIRSTDFPSEWRATQYYGLDNILNGMHGARSDPDGMYDWLPEELEVILKYGPRTAAEVLRDEHDRDASNLENRVRDTRAQLGLDASHALSDDQALDAFILYHATDLSQQKVADRFGVSDTCISQLIKEETYTHLDLPSPAAIHAADAYNDAIDVARRQGDDAR